MPIIVQAPTPPPPALTAEVVRAVMALQKTYCAPTTWAKFTASLKARGFPFPTA